MASSKQVWVDGQRVASWKASGPIRPGDAPLRIGAAGKTGSPTFCSTPISPCRRFTQGRFRPRRSRLDLRRRRLSRPRRSRSARLLAARRGTWRSSRRRVAASTPRPHHQPRNLDDRRPELSSRTCRGQKLTTPPRIPPAVMVCGWPRTISSTAAGRLLTNIAYPKMRGLASTPAESAFRIGGENRLYHTVFIVKKSPSRPKAPIAFLCSTNTWRAYAATPFSDDLERAQEVDRQQWLRQQPGRSAGVLLLSPAPCGAGDLFHRVPNALAGRRSVYADGPGGMGLQPPLPPGSIYPILARIAGLLLRRVQRYRLCTSTRNCSTDTRYCSSSDTVSTGRLRR